MMKLKHFVIGIGRNLQTDQPILIATDCEGNARLLNNEVYLKSEADRYIAELQKKIDDLKNHIGTLKLWYGNAENALHETEETCAVLYKDNDRQKRKRCLAKAEEWRNYAAFCGMQSHCHNHRGFGKTAQTWTWKECHAWRCRKRWIAISEKFKEDE